jgi:hypothetical protein
MSRNKREGESTMKYEDLKVGMTVCDPLPSLGYGTVKRICKKTVWVEFFPESRQDGITIYDLEHLQFLEKAQ